MGDKNGLGVQFYKSAPWQRMLLFLNEGSKTTEFWSKIQIIGLSLILHVL